MDQTIFIIFQILAVLFSIVLHELSHGVVANSLGDPTAKRLGRITLNPIKHLDIFGSVILPIALYIFSQGAFVFGYAKPVPYNPLNLRDQRYGAAKVAAAGPSTNLAIAFLCGLVLRLFKDSGSLMFLDMLSFIVLINIMLAVFNLMPVPPLDGHWLALTFFPGIARIFRQFGIFLFILFLIFVLPFVSQLAFYIFRLIVGP